MKEPKMEFGKCPECGSKIEVYTEIDKEIFSKEERKPQWLCDNCGATESCHDGKEYRGN